MRQRLWHLLRNALTVASSGHFGANFQTITTLCSIFSHFFLSPKASEKYDWTVVLIDADINWIENATLPIESICTLCRNAKPVILVNKLMKIESQMKYMILISLSRSTITICSRIGKCCINTKWEVCHHDKLGIWDSKHAA